MLAANKRETNKQTTNKLLSNGTSLLVAQLGNLFETQFKIQTLPEMIRLFQYFVLINCFKAAFSTASSLHRGTKARSRLLGE